MEVVKLCLSDDTVENGDYCSIVLEFSENDPFFDKKKKLLLDKGFGVKVPMHLKSSSSLDSTCNTLEIMLQIGRIIHLDEVELYFGEHDAQVGFYSTRNELEALHSILLLVNNSLSGQTYKQVNVLQHLQELLIDKIQKMGNKYNEETKFDKSYICDEEKILVQWGENNGVRMKLEIASMEATGRGAIAMEDLKVGDIALEIPVSIIISEDIVYQSDLYNISQKIDGMSAETMLLLWSMKEKHNCDSKFKYYFDTLPKEFNTGLSFGVDAIMALEGTLLLEEIMWAKEHLRNQYDELFPALCNDYPDIFPPEFYTWEQFLWACELWYSNSMKVMFADGKLRTCLIPIAGFLNHSLCPHIVHYGKVDPVTESLKFPLSRPCSAGDQCCLSYGNFSTSHLITFYGFLPQGDNPYDVIPIDIDVGQNDSIEDCPMSYWSNHMVRGTWFLKNNDIFHYGLPTPLLDHLRRLHNPLRQEVDLLQAKLEIELEVLEDLQSAFSAVMENLGDTEFVDCENTSWDVKLAMEYKDLERKIISSNLTSCSVGRKLVESELSKLVSKQ